MSNATEVARRVLDATEAAFRFLVRQFVRFAEWEARWMHALVYKIPGAERFNDWCNEKEREWRRRHFRRHAPEYAALAADLRRAGLDAPAEQIESLL